MPNSSWENHRVWEPGDLCKHIMKYWFKSVGTFASWEEDHKSIWRMLCGQSFSVDSQHPLPPKHTKSVQISSSENKKTVLYHLNSVYKNPSSLVSDS